MYKKILVPCDGSDLAQNTVFPYVTQLARNHDADVVILRVIRPPSGRSATAFRAREPDLPVSMPETQEDARVAQHPIYRDQEIASAVDEAKRSVARAAAVLRDQGLRVTTEVQLGDPAEEIVAYAEQEGVDIIVICSHGSGGIKRWVFGSVAEKVVAGTTVPLLIIRPEGLSHNTAVKE
jgi:nucleotide-binding universal stress UspA family protein